MSIENRIYSQDELEHCGIPTYDYKLNLQPGSFSAKLDLKARQPFGGDLRVFLTFDDGRKVFALVKWFQKELGVADIPVGSKVNLIYTRNKAGNVFMTGIEVME